MRQFVVIIWHQAGGRSNDRTYYCWADESEAARVFPSKKAAEQAWQEAEMGEIHAGTVVEITPEKRDWI